MLPFVSAKFISVFMRRCIVPTVALSLTVEFKLYVISRQKDNFKDLMNSFVSYFIYFTSANALFPLFYGVRTEWLIKVEDPISSAQIWEFENLR